MQQYWTPFNPPGNPTASIANKIIPATQQLLLIICKTSIHLLQKMMIFEENDF